VLSANINGPRWAPVVGFEQRFEISDAGQVRSMRTGRLRRTFRRASGHEAIYLVDGAVRRCLMVHAMVLQAFVGPRPAGCVARHRNGVAWENNLGNLCWGTWLENSADARQHGTTAAGNRNPHAKLTTEAVLAIRASSESRAELAAAHGVRLETISSIRNRQSWLHV
jgi:hypothetical protein